MELLSYGQGVTQSPGNSTRRRSIPAAVEAALWTLSNGRCYAPGCPFPIIYEVRKGIYKKNAQIAHILAVKPGAQRYRQCRTEEEVRERESFKNLLLLCLPHHAEVDDDNYGEELYPPELLREWKSKHEGEQGAQLNRIGPISEEALSRVLTSVFTPPVDRLEKIADQLEQTGTLNSEALEELRQIIGVMQDLPGGPDVRTARSLAYAADVLSTSDLRKSAASLGYASDVLPSLLNRLDQKIRQLQELM
ncbi:hypothetical protein [Actinomadura bangladeshensis]|uniref:HNH endonuclease n=1 Tax=Actinomadura bangladeshensis TaxID=453573 RepID=A0A6L9QDN3_9ACTN|nr:hypothetical protein [Actinomadura bangladeshensis]NEA23126.1 hypothetical protein [Actinomadura bangladeshensis]